MPLFDTRDSETSLVWQLHGWGISYLTCDSFPPHLVKSDPTLFIKQLCNAPDSRVHDASISFFLLHPELAPQILEAYQDSPQDHAENIACLTLAALYLQRLWAVRLTLAFGHPPTLPETPFASFWQERHLPSPDTSFDGILGLEALEKYRQQHHHSGASYQGDWQNQVDHLLWQEDRKPHRNKNLSLSIQPWETLHVAHLPSRLAPLKWVTNQDLTFFFTYLAAAIPSPADLYLADEAIMVSLGIRPGLCIDFDAHLQDYTPLWDIEEQEQLPLHLILKDRYSYPFRLPVRSNPCQLHTDGLLTIYGINLSLIAFHLLWRASTCDIRDLLSLLQDGWLSLPQLDEAIQTTLTSSDITRRATQDEIHLLRQRYRLLHPLFASLATRSS